MTSLSRRAVLKTGAALSAASLLSATALAEAMFAAPPALAPRQRLLFDFDWKFLHGHGTDPAKDLGFGNGQGDFSKSGNFRFATAKFDDSRWRPLNLPHDWAIELPFVNDKALDGHGYKPLGRKYPETSVGWYRKTFDLPKEDASRRLTLDFDGAFRDALVFLNGYFIGRNDNGYAPFSFDITDYILPGATNAVVVRMDASFGDGWFYEGAGIYRHVWLTKTDPLHLAPWETTVRTDVNLAAKTTQLALATIVRNDHSAPAEASVHWKIMDAAGKVVASAESAVQSISAAGHHDFTATATLTAPALWSPDHPSLYTAVASIESGGQTVDAEAIPFGVRTVRFDVDKGFFLNDQPMKLKGTCNHQDHACVGAAVPDRLQYFRLALLKEMGGNAVRTSHNMPTPEWVEACDRMGMMMMCETRNDASTPEGLAQMDTMIRRFRNSPSIILWSVGNEEGALQRSAIGEHVGATMVARAKHLDPTRLTTAAINSSYGTGTSKAIDLEGFNYNLNDIEPYHKTHPMQPLIGSETASTVATRGVYITDKARNWVSAYDLNYPKWASTAEQWWKVYGTRDYLPGGFVWTGFDYRGEPTPYAWPSINSQFGILDMCGFAKDDFFYYKAWWGNEPVLHLLPHWNAPEDASQPVSVWVHTNLDEVELFLNGKSQGKQKVQPLTHLEWKVPYQPGTIEARGSRAGKVVLTDKRDTTGPAVALKITPDRTAIDADGEDLAIFRVEALDARGRFVPTANLLCNFQLTGPGTLLGVGNGDPNCQESDKEPKRSLFMGLAQVIVQTSKTPGTLTLEATAASLTPARVTVTTRPAAPRAIA